MIASRYTGERATVYVCICFVAMRVYVCACECVCALCSPTWSKNKRKNGATCKKNRRWASDSLLYVCCEGV